MLLLKKKTGVITVLFLIGLAMGIAVLISVSHKVDAAELFISRDNGTKKKNNGELFVRPETSSRSRAYGATPGLIMATRGVEEFAQPKTWASMDPVSRKIKEAQTKAVLEDQARTMKQVNALNLKTFANLEKRLSAQEKEMQGMTTKPKTVSTQAVQQPKAIKRSTSAKTTTTVVPKKLFNSPD